MKNFLLFALLLCAQASDAQRVADTPKYIMPAMGENNSGADTAARIPKSPLEILWEEQTVAGANALTEKVTAGFFNTAGNAGIYAFHTIAPRGTVLKVKNLNNDRVIYVKVLGPLPLTNQFKGCSLGLSNAAKAALAARDSKVFCEISYMGY